MIPAVLAVLGSSGSLYLGLALVLVLALTIAGVVIYRAGHNAATVAQERVAAAAEAQRLRAQGDAWRAEMAVPADPDVLLHEHKA